MFTGGTYEVSHYSGKGFSSLQKQCNLTPEEAVVVAQQRRIYLLSKGISLAQITRSMADNPFQSEEAMRVMMNDCLRMKANYRRRA